LLKVQVCLKLAVSSFCVYLFGLESLAVPARDFFFVPTKSLDTDKKEKPQDDAY
jgi:hypothetical protein